MLRSLHVFPFLAGHKLGAPSSESLKYEFFISSGNFKVKSTIPLVHEVKIHR